MTYNFAPTATSFLRVPSRCSPGCCPSFREPRKSVHFVQYNERLQPVPSYTPCLTSRPLLSLPPNSSQRSVNIGSLTFIPQTLAFRFSPFLFHEPITSSVGFRGNQLFITQKPVVALRLANTVAAFMISSDLKLPLLPMVRPTYHLLSR